MGMFHCYVSLPAGNPVGCHMLLPSLKKQNLAPTSGNFIQTRTLEDAHLGFWGSENPKKKTSQMLDTDTDSSHNHESHGNDFMGPNGRWVQSPSGVHFATSMTVGKRVLVAGWSNPFEKKYANAKLDHETPKFRGEFFRQKSLSCHHS